MTHRVAASDDFLGMLQQLVSDYGLPAAPQNDSKDITTTLERSETEELRYTAAWDAYHGALDSDDDMHTRASLRPARSHATLRPHQRRWRPNLLPPRHYFCSEFADITSQPWRP